MAEYTYSSIDSKRITGFYGGNWHTAAGDKAYQGNYAGEESGGDKQRVGCMFWSTMAASLKGKIIKSIKLTCEFANAGYGSTVEKTLRFYTSNYNSYDSSIAPEKYIGTKVQDFVTRAYDNTTTFTFTSGFDILANHFQKGNCGLVIYNNDETSSDGFSIHYLAILSATIEIVYTDAPLRINISNAWFNATPYIYCASTKTWHKGVQQFVYNKDLSTWSTTSS